MVEVAKTDNMVRLGFLQAVLDEAGIGCRVFDAAAGSLWPGAIPRRLMVDDRDAWRAKKLIEAAEREVR